MFNFLLTFLNLLVYLLFVFSFLLDQYKLFREIKNLINLSHLVIILNLNFNKFLLVILKVSKMNLNSPYLILVNVIYILDQNNKDNHDLVILIYIIFIYKYYYLLILNL